ncbi:MAG TPA: thiamine phosphate synthase [Rhodocyclaceae bacterium]|nr:thiamine phosphate synthase [Rhodocyclaceae bacterium]
MAERAMRGLYAITPDEPDTARLLAAVEAALAGGCRWLQYRDKLSAPDGRRVRAAALVSLCRRHGASLIVNDDVELAKAVSADGVHLGREDGSLAAARAALGPQAIIGASCYADLEAARQAAAEGADYVAFGAVYPSPTKPAASRAPIELFARCRTEIDVPVCAIGGITLANAAPLVAAGAALLAVISDLFSASDIAARSAAYQHLFEDNHP